MRKDLEPSRPAPLRSRNEIESATEKQSTLRENTDNPLGAQNDLPFHGPEPIQIIGGVKNPGHFPYREGANLSFYLSEAGAPTQDTETAKIQIIRGEPGRKKAQEFRLGNDQIPSLHSGDIVIVHPPKKTFLARSLTVAASAAAILGTAALVILLV